MGSRKPIDLTGVNPRLVEFVTRNGLTVTSARGGKHNVGSKHPRGLAVDFRTRGMKQEYWEHLERDAHQSGLRLLDERKRPKNQAVWSAGHGHVEVPD